MLTRPSSGCWWTNGPTGLRLPLAQLTGVSISPFTKLVRRRCRLALGFVRRWTLWVRERCKRLATCSGSRCCRRPRAPRKSNTDILENAAPLEYTMDNRNPGVSVVISRGGAGPVDRRLELVREGCMTIQEAALFSGVGRSFLYEAMKRGELPYVKIGSARRIPKRALEEWLAKNVALSNRLDEPAIAEESTDGEAHWSNYWEKWK